MNVQIANPPKEILDGVDWPDGNLFPGDDEVLFWDEFTDTWFRTSNDLVRTAIKVLNQKYYIMGNVSVQEFYYYLGVCPNKYSRYEWDSCFAKAIDIYSVKVSDVIKKRDFVILKYIECPRQRQFMR